MNYADGYVPSGSKLTVGAAVFATSTGFAIDIGCWALDDDLTGFAVHLDRNPAPDAARKLREISRDLIAALREEGLIAAGPRSPNLGAPYAYVTTEKFLLEFGFELLRDLPDLEKLEDAGLLGAASRNEPGRGELALQSATDEAPDKASLLAHLAGVLGLRTEKHEPEEDVA